MQEHEKEIADAIPERASGTDMVFLFLVEVLLGVIVLLGLILFGLGVWGGTWDHAFYGLAFFVVGGGCILLFAKYNLLPTEW